MEGPTSSLLWLEGDTLCTTPTSAGILPGTTSAYLLEQAPKAGLKTVEKLISVGDLKNAEAAWLSSSVRGVAFITQIDGDSVDQRPDITAELDKLAGFEVPE